MSDTQAPPKEHHLVRRLLKAALALLLVLAILFVAGAWYFSGQIGSDGLAVAPSEPEFVTRVDRCCDNDGTIIALKPNAEQARVRTDGTFGLRWTDGQGILSGEAVSDGSSILRTFDEGSGGAPADGTLTDVNAVVWSGTPKQTLGVDYADISIKGPLGAMPAYLLPGKSTTWVVSIHGKGSTRDEPYRVLSVLNKKLGFPAINMTYRNDPGAPADPSGEYGYGLREWTDLQAGVKYALDNGATKVIVSGWSMGGAIVGQFLARSPYADKVVGVVLDAPALDLDAAIRLGAEDRSLPVIGLPIPGALTSAAISLANLRFPTKVNDANAVAPVVGYDKPLFLAHGTADSTTPVQVSDDVVAQRKARGVDTTYVRIKGAEHTEAWNVDRSAYESALIAYARPLL